METCLIGNCRRSPVAKGFCRSHYNTQRIAEQRRVARSDLVCRHCGKTFSGRNSRAIFCSRACNDQAQNATKTQRVRAARPPRRCPQCGRPIAAEAVGQKRFCSIRCSQRHFAKLHAERTKEARWAKVRPCLQCGGEIPRERGSDAIFCSNACRTTARRPGQQVRMRDYMRQRLYGVTPEQFAALLASQDGKCAICQTAEPGGKGNWHVDHDHATGRIRGLLCHSCNTLLGHAKDDSSRLLAAIAYLERGVADVPPEDFSRRG